MQPPRQPRKRASPEGLENSTDAALHPDAAAPVAPAIRSPSESALADITNTHPSPASSAAGSLPHPVRARTTEPGAAVAMPASPGRNRQLFMAQMTPQHMTCDLTSAVVGLGVKHNLQAILVACYPVQKGPPARRHVTLCDQHGATGNPPPYNTACSLSHSGDQGSRCGTPTSTNSPKVISVHQSPSPGLQSHCTRGRRA